MSEDNKTWKNESTLTIDTSYTIPEHYSSDGTDEKVKYIYGRIDEDHFYWVATATNHGKTYNYEGHKYSYGGEIKFEYPKYQHHAASKQSRSATVYARLNGASKGYLSYVY